MSSKCDRWRLLCLLYAMCALVVIHTSIQTVMNRMVTKHRHDNPQGNMKTRIYTDKKPDGLHPMDISKANETSSTKMHIENNLNTTNGFTPVKRTMSVNHLSLDENTKKSINLIKVGILVPSTTHTIKHPTLDTFSLKTMLLPSLENTFENMYSYYIYVGIDKGDFLESVQEEIKNLSTNIRIVISPGRCMRRATNVLAKRAYLDGMDYFLRINDDVSVKTSGWTSKAIAVLRSYNPPNIGVVGPTFKEGKTTILTTDFTHRSHYDIFGYYYPPFFDNWYVDDWITLVYRPERSTKIPDWIISHNIKAHGSRYTFDMKKEAKLANIVDDGKKKITKFIDKKYGILTTL